MSATVVPLTYAPQGALTMFTSTAALAEGRRMVLTGPLLVDLAAVTAADSAALALILDWVRTARGAGQTITLSNLPDGLVSLAVLYGVDSLLPLEPTA